MYVAHARVGMHKMDVETPAFLIDLPAMEHNLALLGDFFAGRKAKLRPHFTSHKMPALAHKQLAAGAVGLTCAKLDEAEVLIYNFAALRVVVRLVSATTYCVQNTCEAASTVFCGATQTRRGDHNDHQDESHSCRASDVSWRVPV